MKSYKNDVYPADLAEAFEITKNHARRQEKKPLKKIKSASQQSNEEEEVVRGVQYMVEKGDQPVNQSNKMMK